MLERDITDKIIKAFYEVYNSLGYGFLEKVYENSMALQLKKYGLQTERQKPIKVYYDGELVGEYFSDLIVENVVIIELKVAKNLTKEHEYQLYNYLKATNIEVGILLNFGSTPEFKRKIFSNDRK